MCSRYVSTALRVCRPQAPSDAPLRLRAGLDVQDLTSGKGAELVFDDSQEFTGA